MNLLNWLLVTLLAMATRAQNYYDNRNQQGGQRGPIGHRPRIGAPVIPILRDDRQGPIDGHYSFEFETGNGIRRQEQGAPTGPNGAVVQQGSWSFTFPDGTPAQFSFIADEGGYRVESPLLPTPPPIPAHALAQIEKAERERAQGIIHDGQYRPGQYDQGGGGFRPQSNAGGSFRPQSSGGGSFRPQSSGGGSFGPQSSGGGSFRPQSSGGGSYRPQSSGGGSFRPQSSGSRRRPQYN